MADNNSKIIINSERILSIDTFKGFSIVLMTFVNTLSPFENVPAWTRHAIMYGLTYVDLIAPFFIFMLALNFKISFKKRVKKFGRRRAYLRYLRRYFIFIGIGLVLFLDINENTFLIRWGTLQVLGTAGLIHLSIAELKPSIRMIIGSILVIVHQFMLSTALASLIYDGIEGGFIGSLSWSAMMIFSSVISDSIMEDKQWKKLLLAGILFLHVGVITSFWFGISRNYITLPYVLTSVGASSLVYFLFHVVFDLLSDKYKQLKSEKILSSSGKNAFMLYILHLLFISFGFELIPLNIEWIIILTIAIVNVFLILVVGYYLDKFQIYLII